MARRPTNVMAALCVALLSIAYLGGRQSTSNSVSAVLADSVRATPWSVVPSPNEGSFSNRLAGVSCSVQTACVAVGWFEEATQLTQTLAETWNGSRWSVMTTLNKGNDGAELSSVSCASPSSCMAVGDYGFSSGKVNTLAETWNGRSWSITPSPNATGRYSALFGVSCVASTHCVAVGDYGNRKTKTLVESWNGSTWSVVPSASPLGGAALISVSCPTSTDCIAVGNYANASGNYKTLVEMWNGTGWSITPSPNRPADDLSDVSCAAPTSCMAVGSYSKSGNALTLVESWNGTDWSIVPSTTPVRTIVYLSGVSCFSVERCVAVGSDEDTLIESWNGTAWSIVSSPNKGDGGSLDSVSCTGQTKCVAAGDFAKDTSKSGFVTRTLVESS